MQCWVLQPHILHLCLCVTAGRQFDFMRGNSRSPTWLKRQASDQKQSFGPILGTTPCSKCEAGHVMSLFVQLC